MSDRSPSRQLSVLRASRGLTALGLLILAGPLLPAAELPLREGNPAPDEMPWQGPEGVRQRVDQIMEREKGQAGVRPRMELHPHRPMDIGNVRPNPNSPNTPIFPAPGGDQPGPTGPNTPQTAGVNFTGATLNDTQSFPPDSMGAAGPAQYIVAVNGRIRSFDKQTGVADGVLNANPDIFFNTVMTPPATNNFTSDPRIRYDRLSQRWFIIMIDVPGFAGVLPNRVLLAVSDGPVVHTNSTWTFFQFQQDLVSPTGDTGKFADYPTLGIDANALYIGVNIFNTSGLGSFFNSTAFVVRKSSVLGAGPIVATAFRKLQSGSGSGPYTPQGVDNYDPAATEGYFIGVDAQFYGLLDLRRISNPGGTPTISATVQITVPATGATITVPHLGNTNGSNGNLDGLDYRLQAAHFRNGRLWTSANLAVDSTGSPSGTDTRMAVRWVELNGIPTGQTPSVVQSGTIFDSSTNARCFWMGTVMVSGQGHAAMGFSVAGANERINAGTVGRLKNDTLGTMRTPLLYTASATAYNPTNDPGGSGGRRWGDFSYTCLDPNDDMTMWTIEEFCDSTDSYGVQVLRLLAPPPAIPSNCLPSSVVAGTTTNVTLAGLSNGDSGFFDPGNGFTNRISAAVNGGGVTLNSITYNNPTNLTLNLTIAPGAVAGARTLTVTNPDGQIATSASAILTIISSGASNVAPVLTAISNRTITELLTLTFTNTATDTNGDTLTFSLDPGAPPNASINPTNGVFTWAPTEAQGPGVSNITVRVTDNGSPPLSDAKSFSVTVVESNLPPVLTAISNRTITEQQTLTITNVASDPDIPANTLTFSLDPGAPPNASINPTNGVFTWTPTEAQGPGVSNITVRVADNGSPPLSDAKSFSVTVLESNLPPVLTTVSNQTIVEQQTLTITNVASDPDIPANTLTFSLDPGAPANASINPTNGVFTWAPTEAQGPGVSNIIVRVTDNGSPPLSDAKSFSVTVLESNLPPVLTAISNQTIVEQQTLTITNLASDPDIPANTLTFSLDPGAPPNASINPANGVFTWTPTEAQGPGVSNITVRVTDNGSPPLSDAKSFSVTVLESNLPPVLTTVSNQTIVEQHTLTITNVANDPDIPANTLTFSLDPGAPPNASINPTNGVFTWTPTEAEGPGVSNITVRVTDNGSPPLSDAKSFSVTVLESNLPPVLTAISNQTIVEQQTLTITNLASDPDIPANTLTFSLDPGAPPNASINPTNGVFTWTPTEAEGPGVSNITVRVTDNGSPPLSDAKTFSVTVLESNLPPVLTTISNQTIVEQHTLTITNVASDPDIPANTLTFSLDPGAPPNASINPTNGVFTWTPTEAEGPGVSNITVRVTDNGSPPLSDAKTFSVTVLESNLPPVLTAISNQTIIEQQTLTITNVASDPDIPANTLTFSLDPGAPPNASINPTNGVFTWLPTEAQGPGVSNITVRVTDNGSPPLSDAKTFSVTVLESNLPPVLTTISNQTIVEQHILTITNVASDPDIPANTLTFSLDPGAPPNASINPTNGVFTWTPTEAEGPGVSNITVRVTDNGSPPLSDAKTFSVTVLESNSPPLLATIASVTVHVGTTVLVTNSATDPDIPANTLTFSLDPGAPAASSINATNGVFIWTPDSSYASTTNPVTVRVTDDGVPPASDTKTFIVTVESAPLIQTILISNSVATLTWTAIAGQSYRLQYKADLSDTIWTNSPPDVMAGGTTASKDDSFDSTTQRFYRVFVVP